MSCGYTKSYGHPRREVMKRLEPFTENLSTGHKFRWAFDPDGSGPLRRRTRNVSSYKEAIYTTARNGNIVVTSDGTRYDVKFSGSVTVSSNSPLRP